MCIKSLRFDWTCRCRFLRVRRHSISQNIHSLTIRNTGTRLRTKQGPSASLVHFLESFRDKTFLSVEDLDTVLEKSIKSHLVRERASKCMAKMLLFYHEIIPVRYFFSQLFLQSHTHTRIKKTGTKRTVLETRNTSQEPQITTITSCRRRKEDTKKSIQTRRRRGDEQTKEFQQIF